jgi:hypothetical protein
MLLWVLCGIVGPTTRAGSGLVDHKIGRCDARDGDQECVWSGGCVEACCVSGYVVWGVLEWSLGGSDKLQPVPIVADRFNDRLVHPCSGDQVDSAFWASNTCASMNC